jgi:molecular chaperone GrpE
VSSAYEQSAQEHASAAYARSGAAPESGEREPDNVVINDKRRIDPSTGSVREYPAPDPASAAPRPAPTGAPQPEGDGDDDPELAQARVALAERTADLQRLKAEFDNYRRRVERDRQATTDAAAGRVLFGLLPTLDDIGRARGHDDLNGTFKTVAEGLENTLETLGLERYGEKGEPFDPTLHEALVYTSAPGLTGPTCVEVYRPGYRHAGKVLRPAQVVVADAPEGASGGSAASSANAADASATPPVNAAAAPPGTAADGTTDRE